MDNKCNGCRYLKGETEIGLAYCGKLDELIFTDSGCPDGPTLDPDVVRWVSFDEEGLNNNWKVYPSIKSMCVYRNKPVLDPVTGGYVEPEYLSGESTEATAAQESILPGDSELKNILEELLPGFEELSGTNDLFRVTIEKIKG